MTDYNKWANFTGDTSSDDEDPKDAPSNIMSLINSMRILTTDKCNGTTTFPDKAKPETNNAHFDAKSKKIYDDLFAIGAGDFIKPVTTKTRFGFEGKLSTRWPSSTGNCFLSALYKNRYKLDATKGESELDRVIFEEGCMLCGKNIEVTVRHALAQEDFGFNLYRAENEMDPDGPVKCQNCCRKCDGDGNCKHEELGPVGFFIRGLCIGNPELDDGRGVHHCMKCVGFGDCATEAKDSHCEKCGKHYYEGFSLIGQCNACYPDYKKIIDRTNDLTCRKFHTDVQNQRAKVLNKRLDEWRKQVKKDGGVCVGKGQTFEWR
jgi:hypothetical protein